MVLPAYQASADIVLGAGSSLGPGQQLCTYSDFGNVCLVNQSTDGNIVEYLEGAATGAQPLWATNTGGYPGDVLVMQTDGNMVVYYNGRAIWALSNYVPCCYPGSVLTLQSDDHLVVYKPNNGGTVWASPWYQPQGEGAGIDNWTTWQECDVSGCGAVYWVEYDIDNFSVALHYTPQNFYHIDEDYWESFWYQKPDQAEVYVSNREQQNHYCCFNTGAVQYAASYPGSGYTVMGCVYSNGHPSDACLHTSWNNLGVNYQNGWYVTNAAILNSYISFVPDADSPYPAFAYSHTTP